MYTFSSEYKQHYYVFLSILLGIIGFSVTYFLIFYFTTSNYESYNSCEEAKATTAFYNFPPDSIALVSNTYREDIQRFEHIKINKNTDCTDSKGMFFMMSEFTPSYIYSSADGRNLRHTIRALDFKYAEKLGRNKIISPYFFNQFPKASLWIILISIATGFSFFLIPFFLAGILEYGKGLSTPVKLKNIFFAILLITLLLVAQFLPDSISEDFMLFKASQVKAHFGFGFHPTTLYFGATASYISIIIWMILIFTVNTKLTSLYKTDRNTLLKKFPVIHKDLETYFIIIGVFLAFTIFCTDTLTQAMNDFISDDIAFFPKEFAFMMGLVQTFFLILLYSSIYGNLYYIKRAVKNDVHTPSEFKEILSAKPTLGNSLKIILTVLAPVIGSGLQNLISLFHGG